MGEEKEGLGMVWKADWCMKEMEWLLAGWDEPAQLKSQLGDLVS